MFVTTVNSNFLFYPAQKVTPFYEEWWFLVVVALVGLIFILLLVFILIIRGQSKKYAKKSESGERRRGSFNHLHFKYRAVNLMQVFFRKRRVLILNEWDN